MSGRGEGACGSSAVLDAPAGCSFDLQNPFPISRCLYAGLMKMDLRKVGYHENRPKFDEI